MAKEINVSNYYRNNNQAELPLSILALLGMIGLTTLFHYLLVQLLFPELTETRCWSFVMGLNLVLACHYSILAFIAYKVMPVFMVKPHRNPAAEESVDQIEEIKKVSITYNDYLQGYLLSGSNPNRVMIFFGGIDETAADNIYQFYLKKKNGSFLVDCDVAAIDWPQYGQSSGKANMESMKQAAVDIVSYFQQSYNHVVLAGYSMGSGYAVYADSICNCDDLILFAPYAHSRDLYNGKVNVFHGIFQGLLAYKLPVSTYARKIAKVPLIFASENDRRVTNKTTYKLAENFQNGAKLILFKNLTHAEIPLDEGVLSLVSERIQD